MRNDLLQIVASLFLAAIAIEMSTAVRELLSGILTMAIPISSGNFENSKGLTLLYRVFYCLLILSLLLFCAVQF